MRTISHTKFGTMPPAVIKAHQTLDKAVDKRYRQQSFANDAKRVDYLFEPYDEVYKGGVGEGGEEKSR